MNGKSNTPDIPRDHFETRRFSEQATAIQPDRRAFDEWMEGVLFVICRTPEQFPFVGRIGRARLDADPFRQRPALWILFCHDDSQVALIHIEVEEV
jgi:hypothetical protein